MEVPTSMLYLSNISKQRQNLSSRQARGYHRLFLESRALPRPHFIHPGLFTPKNQLSIRRHLTRELILKRTHTDSYHNTSTTRWPRACIHVHTRVHALVHTWTGRSYVLRYTIDGCTIVGPGPWKETERAANFIIFSLFT